MIIDLNIKLLLAIQQLYLQWFSDTNRIFAYPHNNNSFRLFYVFELFDDSSNNYEDKIKLENNKVVNFMSPEQNLYFAIGCNGNSTFAEIEEKLYKEYPEFRETNNSFLANGSTILRFKTINENKIGERKPIIMVRPS